MTTTFTHSLSGGARTLYLPVDQIKVRDILPDKSTSPVLGVVVVPWSHVTVIHSSGYVWHAGHGGPDFGFSSVRIERRDQG